MRGKRAKAYKKEMSQFHQAFGFREPYQILVDSEMMQEASRCTMDLAPAFERTLRGKVKPMITQCSIRHLYALPAATNPHKNAIIDTAKTFERRKCNHHELDEPLPEHECFQAVVVRNGENKHRYCIAAMNKEIRTNMREVPGVPSIVINRSVMILEPMTDATKFRRDRMERGKILAGITGGRQPEQVGEKRKRTEDGEEEKEGGDGAEAAEKKKKKKQRGPKGVNPLAMKKKKPKASEGGAAKKEDGAETEAQAKKRRKRKHGAPKSGEGAGPAEVTAAGEAKVEA
ncbi:Fcf1-domain-containing protein [Geopyxis carbonaria]|nr:Fcf1-domain-containing protein [Geopyxis carbonaria]